jgi:transglutaminase-like putative cysteine protease
MLRSTLNHLPRDTRDTLFMLLVISWVVAPLLGQLPLWCSLLTAVVMLWRGTLAWRGLPLPSKWWRMGLLALTTGATLITFKTLLGRDAGVSMVVVLLAMKTLELRARRDALVVFFLSFFLMLTNFFYSQSLLTAAAMLIGLLGLLTALVNAHMPVGKPPLWEAARIAGGMTLLGAPIMVLLFMLFPRMAPLWGMPGDAMTGRSGLSASMTVGNIARLALDDGVAMRIRFDGVVPAQSELYFRGPVLSSFDGQHWEPLDRYVSGRASNAALKVQDPAIRYEVTLEPNQQPWLLTLDATPNTPELPGVRARMTAELQWVMDHNATELLRYSVTSYTRFQHGPLDFTSYLQPWLALPGGYNPRTLQLAREIKNSTTQANANGTYWVSQVLQRLRTGGYSYTLDPGLYGRHTADEFWFDRKEGFCEHIASSFVILMRALGVPARVVTGYQGGERNPIDGFWTVRQSDAHAWAEVWLAGQGWVRVDPTSAVAPGRTGSLLRLQTPRGVVAAALFGNVNPSIALGLRAAWDAINNSWNQWVLNYTQKTQFNLLKNLGFESPSWENLVYLLCAVVVTSSLMGALISAWGRHRQDPWLRLLALASQRLQRAGLTPPKNSTPRQMAQLLLAQGSSAPDAQAMHHWLLRLEALRYAPATSSSAQRPSFKQSLAQLQRELRQLRWGR